MSETDKKISFLLENAAWPVLVVDDSGVVREANYRASTTFSVTITLGATNLSGMWGDRNPWNAASFLAQWKASQSLVDIGFKFKDGGDVTVPTSIALSTHDGQRHFVLQLLRPVSGAKGGAAAGSRDDSAQQQKLECALKLARTVALDFNNALTSILGYTSLMLHRSEASHPWRDNLMEIEKSAEKAAEVAHDLATFSLEERNLKDESAGNLNELLRNTCAILRTTAPEGINWNHDFDKGLFHVKFDEAKMQQVFIKLLENSVQAMEEGSGIINIKTASIRNDSVLDPEEAGLQVSQPLVRVEISDDGVGIAKDSLSRVFEPFFTTKEGHRGLGLAWVYGVVTNHGGSVLVSSVEGEGTKARIYLPAQSTTVENDGEDDTELEGSQTILMVDDEELLLTMGR